MLWKTYTEAILQDVLCRGLEIQLDLLGVKNQDMTLEQMLRFIEAKEAGKRSATLLLLPHATDAITGSAYKCQERHPGETVVKGARFLFILWKEGSWQECACSLKMHLPSKSGSVGTNCLASILLHVV